MKPKFSRLAQNRARLFYMLAALMLVGFAATALISHYAARNLERQTIAQTELPLLADGVFAEIQRDLARPTIVASMMARDTFLRDWAISGERNPAQITRYLQEIQSHYKASSAFFVSDNTRSYYQSDGLLKKISATEPRDAWYFRVRAQSEPYELTADADAANRDRPTVFINYRVMGYSREFIGVVGVGLALDSVVRLVNDYQQRFDRRIYFVDDKGRIVLSAKGGSNMGTAAQRIQEVPGLSELAQDILLAHKGNFDFEQDGERHHLAVRYVPELKWHVFVEKLEARGFRGSGRIVLLNFLVCLAVAMVVFGLAYWAVTRYQLPLEKMAMTDGLTGLNNRHALALLLHQSVLEAARLGTPMSAILLDIDHFKAVNDRLGHVATDQILTHVALTLKTSLRSSDMACRWGGEEFLVVLKNADLNEAVRLAETLRRNISARQAGEDGNTVGITISAGVASYRTGETHESLVARADKALYRAKRDGRNRVCQELPGDSGVAPLLPSAPTMPGTLNR